MRQMPQEERQNVLNKLLFLTCFALQENVKKNYPIY